MAAIIYTAARPNAVNWSENYMYLSLGYSSFLSGWKIEVELLNAANDELISSTLYTVADTNGTLDIKDIQNQIDYYISHQLPFTDNVEELLTNKVVVKLRYRPYSPGTGFTWIVDSTTFIVYKGGISSMVSKKEFEINNGGYNRAKFCPNGVLFLTWVPSGRLMTPTERGFITYFHDQSYEPEVKYNVRYLDGTTGSITKTIPDTAGTGNYQYRAWHIPIGIEEALLDPADKGVDYYDVQVWQAGTANNLATYRINVDKRPFYNTHVLYYLNSLGGLDQIQLKGLVQANSGEVKRYEQRLHRIDNDSKGDEPFYNTEMRIQFEGNTGYISKAHKVALTDLCRTRFCALYYDNYFLPMRCTTEQLPVVGSKDSLHAYKISFETASRYKTMPKELIALI